MAQALRRPSEGPVRSSNRYQVNAYVDGNTVRKPLSERVPARTEPSRKTRENRERALRMNMGYVVFLTLVAVVTVAVSIGYLKLKAENTTLQKNVTSLTTQLAAQKLENDAEYNRIISSVNLEHVKSVAMNKLGMVYAGSSQIRTYDVTESDYVKQYQEIPVG